MKALQAALGARYQLGSVVGQGATALVYAAQDRRFDRPVAVKMLRPELTATVTADRFLLEIETAARLQHPHILPIYDAGSDDGILYYVMPLVPGESLRDLLLREPVLAWDRALRITQQVAEALAFAHEQRVLHRDVKPENILLLADQAMVADFGIAKVLAGATHNARVANVTMPGMGIGTPAYMSPEQAFSDTGIDERTDVYSLACVLHEMLDGAAPFRGPTLMAVLAQKTTGVTRELRVAGTGVPAHVPGVLQRAMATEPSERPADMRDFLLALRGSDASGRGAARVTAAAAAPAGVVSIAVLPFGNIGGNADDEFLSDGITEDLIHALTQVHGLRVVGRSSSFAFKQRGVDARDAGGQLGVATVLDGTVRRAAGRLRLVAHLVDVASGFELWSERFESSVTDVFDLQDEITLAIVSRLKVQLLRTPERAPGDRTAHPEAYQAFLRGRFEWNQRTAPSLRRARVHLEEATALDPGFAPAHAALADALVTLAIYGVEAPSIAMPAAAAAVARALALQPGLAEALPARGSITALYDLDWQRAEAEYRAAVIANPANSGAHHWRAMHALVPQGRFAEAHESLERALRLDPLASSIAASHAIVHYYRRDFASALAELDALLARTPDFGLATYFRSLVLTAAGRAPEAVTALERLTASSPEHAELEASLGVAHAVSGNVAGAFAALSRLDALAGVGFVSPALRAQVHAAVGDADAAFAALKEARRVRAVDLPLLAVRPAFDELRTDTRYEALVAHLGLTNTAAHMARPIGTP